LIAFVQTFGLHTESGGSRVLRSLLRTSHPPALSINTGLIPARPDPEVEEVHIPLRHNFGGIEFTRLRPFLGVFDWLSSSRFETRLRQTLESYQVRAIHLIPHAYEVVPVARVAREMGLPLFLTVHDDITYTSCGHPCLRQMAAALGSAWRTARGLFVISDEMGREYSQRFGAREYSVVTDGLTCVPNGPKRRPDKSLRLYFMGLFHYTYNPNLRAVLDALKIIRGKLPDWNISLTCRCGEISLPVCSDDVPLEVRPFAREEDVENDMLSADVLYQPLPLDASAKSFGRFSMSTKMITYLGSGLPIFYHGPEDAAAYQLLMRHKAAVACTTLNPEELAKVLLGAVERREAVVRNALALARRQFILAEQQRRFWEPINEICNGS